MTTTTDELASLLLMNSGPRQFLWLAAATDMINDNGVILGTMFQLSPLFMNSLLLSHGSHDLVQAHDSIQHQGLNKLGISDADNDPVMEQLVCKSPVSVVTCFP